MIILNIHVMEVRGVGAFGNIALNMVKWQGQGIKFHFHALHRLDSSSMDVH